MKAGNLCCNPFCLNNPARSPPSNESFFGQTSFKAQMGYLKVLILKG
ncbi:hypothetical protein C8D93_101372 [Sinimarinibacterium flocculans]|uniref:Uncharacterized protein n=1 Tax=Sinimarinibacterium flocculans TaxID=985250 RepID=A0A318EEX1_9GAMM|nr:hypothetical protein C8D93_101372 [Sinimarinibacterium flocculans]